MNKTQYKWEQDEDLRNANSAPDLSETVELEDAMDWWNDREESFQQEVILREFREWKE